MARKYEIISKLAEETAKEVQKPAVKSVSKAPETKKETSAEKAKEEINFMDIIISMDGFYILYVTTNRTSLIRAKWKNSLIII